MGSGQNGFFNNKITSDKRIDPLGVTEALFPSPPKLPKPPPVVDPEEERRRSKLAADAAKLKQSAALSFSKQIKTGATGLGQVPSANKGQNTAIGA